MERRTAGMIAWPALALFVGLAGVALWLLFLGYGAGGAADDLVMAAIFSGWGVVGALVVSRQPGNVIGWLFLGIAVAASIAFFTDTYAQHSFEIRSTPLPGAGWAAWLSSWAWVAFIFPAVAFLPLLFPDGHLPSPRWRPYAWFAGVYLVVVTAGFALQPGRIETYPVRNPVGVEVLDGADVMEELALLGFLALSLVSVASLFLRYRRGAPERRQQIKWFAFAAGLLVAWLAVSTVVEALGFSVGAVDTVGSAVAFLSLPVGAGIGILRYRLFDIDVVINRAALFAILAALVTAVYVGIVVGIGAAIGSRGNLLLSILATALIAVGFQPARERARRFANRLVYGKRATPYEVLSDFADRVGGSYATEDVLPRMARVVGEGTGASRAEVWLRVGEEIHRAGSWPSQQVAERLGMVDGSLPAIPGSERAYAVLERGELLGALSIAKPPGEPLSPAEDTLLADLAAQAGLILRNARLIEELRASRQRLVTAQDEERRRLERNIHDGAQQQLVALAVKMNLVESLAGKDPAKAAGMAAQAKAELQQALEELRDLARGIYPPLLADKGLGAALDSQARKAAVPVTVDPDGIGRYSQEAEAAAYFCVLEALQNAAKYADPSRVEVRLSQDDGHLVFTVTDDGRGFDPATTPRGTGLQNMADRIEALGGTVEISSTRGHGTVVSGRIPVEGGR